MSELTRSMTKLQEAAYKNALHGDIERLGVQSRVLPGGIVIALSLNK